MFSYYEKIRAETKVVEALDSSETEDESSFALKRLRPNDYQNAEEKGKVLKF
jgi:hypothetical protein